MPAASERYARRLGTIAPEEVEDERYYQLSALLYEADQELGQKAQRPGYVVLEGPRDDRPQDTTPQEADRYRR
jgi:hypothetical protein